MALQNNYLHMWPGPLPIGNGTAPLLIDASGEMAAHIVVIGKAGNIHKVWIRLGAVTTGQTLKVSLQDLDGNGDPDGTPDQSGTVAVADSDDNTWKSVTLGSDRAVTVGQRLAINVEYNATVGNLNVVTSAFISGANLNNSYSDLKTGGTWAKSLRAPVVVLEFDDGTICPLLGAMPLICTNIDVASNTTPDEIALKFQVPFSCKCHGIWYGGRLSGDVDFVLYAANGTSVQGTVSNDKDAVASASDSISANLFDPVTLSINTVYYAALKPTSTTSMRLYYGDVSTAAHLDTLPGGQNAHYAEQTDAGGFSATTTRRPFIGVILSAFDDGVGGGSGSGIIGDRFVGGQMTY